MFKKYFPIIPFLKLTHLFREFCLEDFYILNVQHIFCHLLLFLDEIFGIYCRIIGRFLYDRKTAIWKQHSHVNRKFVGQHQIQYLDIMQNTKIKYNKGELKISSKMNLCFCFLLCIRHRCINRIRAVLTFEYSSKVGIFC